MTEFVRRDLGIGLLPTSGLVLGQTDLLRRFLELASSYSCGTFFLAAPFFDSAFVETLLGYLLPEKTAFELIVKDRQSACDLYDLFGQRRSRGVSIRIADRLHAKVFIFESAKFDLLGVVGSHNATAAAISQNLEAGAFIGGRLGSREWRHLFDLRNSLRASSTSYVGEITAGSPRRESDDEYDHSFN